RQFVGTLRYASPEQVLAVGRLDPRSDVYSLGATLWELLTLRPLFGATEQTPTPELMQRIQYEEPSRLRHHNPSAPPDLEAIVHKGLGEDVGRRYAAGQDLAQDLESYLSGEPVRARPAGGWDRAAKWVRRHPARAAAYALFFLALVLGVGVGGAVALWRRAEM